MPKPPAFQLYANDWLSSTKIALMPPADEGAYIRLLCHEWNDPDCSLPDDDEVLAQLSRLGEGWFKGGSQVLRACFVPHPSKPGRLINPRLFEERQKQEAWREKSRLGGINSGRSRALTAKGSSRMVQTTREPKSNISSSSSSSISKKKEFPYSSPCAQKAESPPPKPKQRPPTRVPLPDSYAISDDVWDWATEHGYDRVFVEREFEKFCDRNRAKGEIYANWDAAFKNWLRRAEEFNAHGNGRKPVPPHGLHNEVKQVVL